MRWPWSREPAAEPAPEVAAAAPAVAPADPRPSPMGWAFLPPIQRTLDTPIAPVTRPTAFPADLPAWRSPAFTSALSHAVVDTAPGGVVDGDGGGLGEPSHPVGSAPELTLLPPPRPTAALQRSVADPAPAEEPAAPEDHHEPDEPHVVRPEPPPAALTRAPSAGMPVVHRSVVGDAPREPAPPPPSEPAGEVGPDDLPDRPPLGPIAAAPEVPVPSPSPGEVGRPAVVQRSVATPLAPAAAVVAPAVQRAAPTDVSVHPAKPRLGLGAPLPIAPATAVPTPPSAESSDLPRESGEMTIESAGLDGALSRFADSAETGFTEVPIQRAIGPTPPPSSRPTQEPLAAKVPAPVDLATPELTLARSVDPAAQQVPPSSPAPDPDPVPAEAAGPGAAGGRVRVASATSSTDESSAAEPVVEPPPALLPSAPLPLAGGIATSIQRADLLPGPGTPTPSLVVQPAPLLPTRPNRERAVPIQRLAIGGMRTTAAPAATPRPTVSPSAVQRSASPEALAGNPLPGAATQVGADLDVPFAVGGAAPAPLDAGRPGGVVRSALPGPVLSRSVEADPATVSRSTPSAEPPTMPLAAAPPVPVAVQAAADDEQSAAAVADPADAPPRAEGDGAAPSAPGDVTVQTAAAPTASAAAPGNAGGGGSATGDVDALAQKLFPAVLRRMKAELLLDRERRGVRTDPW